MIKRKKPKTGLYLALALLITFSCTPPTPKDLAAESLIPKPSSINATGSSFRVKANTRVTFDEGSEELGSIANYFAKLIRPATGFELEIAGTTEPSNGSIHLGIASFPDLGDEGYELTITNKQVTLLGNTPEGVFRGIQTIRQLLPPEIEGETTQAIPWELASGSIRDTPAYSYRGSMFDISRHFFDVEDLKQYIDWLAMYKMNVLHLHLTDDQGWRIEIKKWPKLTEVGGSTEVGGGEAAGYLTQSQYTEIVEYANDRYITIVPEIDMPGHTNAALASYAELNCDDKVKELYTGTEVGFSTFCTEKEIVYEFIADVIRELAAITPGPYIHVGGDESHSTEKEDYIYFIERVQEIVLNEGKQMIGWDEVVSTKVDPSSIAQVWASEENAQLAVEKGIKVIMSPARKAYLDMKYDSTTTLGLHWAGYIEIDTSYIWDPENLIPYVGKENILGVESPLWTETLTNMDEVAFMVFPRLLSYAEIGWSSTEVRNWDDYKVRLGNHSSRFKEMELNYYASDQIDWLEDPKELEHN